MLAHCCFALVAHCWSQHCLHQVSQTLDQCIYTNVGQLWSLNIEPVIKYVLVQQWWPTLGQ